MTKKLRSGLLRLLLVVVGNLVFSFGIAVFSIPNRFLVGGTTGIGRIMEQYFALPVAITVAGINVLMFALGFLVLGKGFAITTLISTVIYPVFLDFFMSVEALKNMTSDLLLASILSGIILGGGLGLVLRMGGSTGGMDIPPIILNKKTRIPIAVGMYFFDVVILGVQMLFSSTEQVLYGLLSVLITTVVLNKVIVTGAGDVQVTIMSKMSEQINAHIQKSMDRGSTFIPVETGYLGESQKAIMCVLPSREVSLLNRDVLEIDPQAFIVINSVRDVRGKGFTLAR